MTSQTAARQAAQEPATASARAEKHPASRNAFLDNAKFLLVTLVVIGHSWTLLPDVSTGSPVYVFLYLFHVPAFVLVTGYLSRSFAFSRSNLRKLFTTIVVPYFIFESLLALFRTTIGGEDLGLLYLSPHWPMWYLSVLFLWRLATPVVKRVPHPMWVAVAVCLVGGVVTVDELDVARATGLLPFFVAGMLMKREQFEALARPRVRVAAVAALSTAFVVSSLVAGSFSKEWLYWRTGYPDLGVPFWFGASVRLGLLAVAFVLALSVLSLIPTTRRWFTGLGAASLVVYLFHGFFVKAGEYAGVGPASEADPVTAFVLVTAASVALSLLLSAGPVARWLNTLVDPISTLGSDRPSALEISRRRALQPDQVPVSHRNALH